MSSAPKPIACSSRVLATSDGTSGELPYLTRILSPSGVRQSNFGAVPFSCEISKVQLIIFGWFGSAASRARLISGGWRQIDARASASARSSAETVLAFAGFDAAGLSGFADLSCEGIVAAPIAIAAGRVNSAVT